MSIETHLTEEDIKKLNAIKIKSIKDNETVKK